MDLFSAMILGPADTLYQDCPFFFDIALPASYPNGLSDARMISMCSSCMLEPPKFHYVSYTHGRLNPNLYEEGKVCVSLLGTWAGHTTETWGPQSNLLQVLVSIQGLILCKEPFYNEPGYEGFRGTDDVWRVNHSDGLIAYAGRVTAIAASTTRQHWQEQLRPCWRLLGTRRRTFTHTRSTTLQRAERPF